MNVVLALIAALGILFAAITKAVIERLAERMACWALPDGQPLTFRLAWCAVQLAKLAAPSHGYEGEPLLNFRRMVLVWPGADEALADLEDDLSAGSRVIDPLRLVGPVLAEAMRLRMANAFVHLQQLAGMLGLVLFAAATAPVAMGLIIVMILGLAVLALDAGLNRGRIGKRFFGTRPRPVLRRARS